MGVPARLKSRAKLNLSQRRLNFWTEAPMLNVLCFWVGADSGQDPKGLSAELPQCLKGHSSLCRGTPASEGSPTELPLFALALGVRWGGAGVAERQQQGTGRLGRGYVPLPVATQLKRLLCPKLASSAEKNQTCSAHDSQAGNPTDIHTRMHTCAYATRTQAGICTRMRVHTCTCTHTQTHTKDLSHVPLRGRCEET